MTSDPDNEAIQGRVIEHLDRDDRIMNTGAAMIAAIIQYHCCDYIQPGNISFNDIGAVQHRTDEYCDWVATPCQSVFVLGYLLLCVGAVVGRNLRCDRSRDEDGPWTAPMEHVANAIGNYTDLR